MALTREQATCVMCGKFHSAYVEGSRLVMPVIECECMKTTILNDK